MMSVAKRPFEVSERMQDKRGLFCGSFVPSTLLSCKHNLSSDDETLRKRLKRLDIEKSGDEEQSMREEEAEVHNEPPTCTAEEHPDDEPREQEKTAVSKIPRLIMSDCALEYIQSVQEMERLEEKRRLEKSRESQLQMVVYRPPPAQEAENVVPMDI